MSSISIIGGMVPWQFRPKGNLPAVLLESLAVADNEAVTLALGSISCNHIAMAQLLVRHLDDDVKAKLQLRARRHGHSTEEVTLEEDLENRVLSFDQSAAQAAGRIAAERRRAGRTTEIRDIQIAGIVSVRKATLATRNTRHFEGCGLVLVDPWSA